MVKNVGRCVLRFVRYDIAIREVGTFSFVVVRVAPIAGRGGRRGRLAAFGNVTESSEGIYIIIGWDVQKYSSTQGSTNVVSRAIGPNGGVNDNIVLRVPSVESQGGGGFLHVEQSQ